jgi:hypothetical protein
MQNDEQELQEMQNEEQPQQKDHHEEQLHHAMQFQNQDKDQTHQDSQIQMELGSGNNVEVSGFVVFFSFYLITFSPNLSKNMSTYFAVVTIYT